MAVLLDAVVVVRRVGRAAVVIVAVSAICVPTFVKRWLAQGPRPPLSAYEICLLVPIEEPFSWAVFSLVWFVCTELVTVGLGIRIVVVVVVVMLVTNALATVWPTSTTDGLAVCASTKPSWSSSQCVLIPFVIVCLLITLQGIAMFSAHCKSCCCWW